LPSPLYRRYFDFDKFHRIGYQKYCIYYEKYYGFDISDGEREIVRDIVARCYRNTLLIELVAKGAILMHADLGAYRDKLDKVGFICITEDVSSSRDRKEQKVTEHLHSLYNMLELSEERQYILRNIALMPSIEIPTAVTDWINCELSDVNYLASIGWLEDTRSGFRMHPLVKETILLDEIPDGTTDAFVGYMSDDENVNKSGGMLDVMLGHEKVGERIQIAVAMLDEAEKSGDESEDFATACNNLGGAMYEQGRYDEALENLRKALAIYELTLPEDHPSTAASYNNIGLVYDAQGAYDEALECLRKALAIRERTLGENHPDTAASYNNIGAVYHAQGEYDEALEYYEKDLAICKRTYGENHSSTATSYNNIGAVYYAQGKYDEALECHEKALAIYRRTLGEDHPSTAASYNNIGAVYYAQGKYDEALECFEKALAICKRTLLEDHPDTAMNYHNIGGVYISIKKYKDAREHLRKAEAIRTEKLGETHPDTLSTRKALAHLDSIDPQE